MAGYRESSLAKASEDADSVQAKILEAIRTFSAYDYDGTRTRSVAAAAGVDVAQVHCCWDSRALRSSLSDRTSSRFT